jgi:plasmid stabilization system protein ParE
VTGAETQYIETERRHVYSYLVFYEATESEIIIYAVRHAARDPSSMPGSA